MAVAYSFRRGKALPWRFVRLLSLCLVTLLVPLFLYSAGELSSHSHDAHSRKVLSHPKLNLMLKSTPELEEQQSNLESSVPVPVNVPQETVNHIAGQSAIATAPILDQGKSTPSLQHTSRVHAFYYPWYASPSVEGYYLHWNHRVLPFWGDKHAAAKAHVFHAPPNDIGAQFYPALGPYSSRDKTVIRTHVQQMRSAGIGVAVVSWYPPQLADPNGKPSDDVIPLLLDAGQKYNVSIAFHLEPYEPHEVKRIFNDIHYIIDHYGSHPAFYRMTLAGKGKGRPVVYVYDSYKIPAEQWSSMLSKSGKMSIRDTEYDCIMVGLVVKRNDLEDLHKAGFDGSYTYFASTSFTFGSNPKNWKWLSEMSQKLDMVFIPSVGPGYDDTALRPWNADTKQDRASGKYYREMIASALELDIEAVSITSFNEWGEGTQIEPAVPFTPSDGKRVYLNYAPLQPESYLAMTREELKNFVPAQL